MKILVCYLDKNEFNRVSICKSPFEIQRTLKTTHDGTNKVKQTKISMLKNQLQLFRMNAKESISDMYSRLQDITHPLMQLGESNFEFYIVSKILNSLTNEWERKVLAIEEANDLSKLKVEELIGNLMLYEVSLHVRKQLDQEKKSVAFQVEEEMDFNLNDMAYIAKGFKKILKSSTMEKKQ